MIVYISIGNSDDKLTQAEWAAFYSQTSIGIRHKASQVHGQWVSEPASSFQNACWCAEIEAERALQLKHWLTELARQWRQDSIAWAEVPHTEFLGPGDGR